MTDALKFQSLNYSGLSAITGSTDHVVDASNEGIAWCFLSETDQPITKLWFRYGARTGTPPTYRISLQSIDTSGNPDGTVLGGGSPASATFTPPADASWNGLGQWVTLTNSYTPSLGQMLVIVIEYSSGTIDGSNNSSFTRGWNTGGSLAGGLPFVMVNSGGTWSKVNNGGVYAYATSSNRYGLPAVSAYTTTVSTTGHRSAAGFTLPSGWGQTYALAGFSMAGRIGGSGATAKFGVWNESGTMLAESITLDCDASGNLTGTQNTRAIFTSVVNLNFGTKYYVGVENGGSVCSMHGAVLTEADDRLCFPLGANVVHATWNGSAWTDVTTIRPSFDLIFADITPPSGGSGIILNPGFGGGFNG